MSGNKLFVDTNIVIYLLSGDDVLASFFNGRSLYLSYITELELLSYSSITTEDENRINDFLEDCSLVDFNPYIKHYTISLRRKHRLKLPDSIIAASAAYLNIPLITADLKMQDLIEVDVIGYNKK